MARTRWISARLLAALAAIAAPRALSAQAPPAATGQLTPAERVEQEIRSLAQTLESPPGADAGARRAAREEAARRLAQRGSAADEVLIGALTTNPSRDVKLAVLRAIPLHPRPPEAFIAPAAELLSDRPLCEAAAEALARFKASREALDLLIGFARDPDQAMAQRSIAARAIGTIPEQRAAAALVGLLSAREVRAAAADGLAELSGLDLGRDPKRWREWYDANADKPPERWKADLLTERAAGRDALRRQRDELAGELGAILHRQYRSTPKDARPAFLLELLRSPQPYIRAKAAQLVRDAFGEGGVTEPMRDRLVELVGDSSPAVRLEVSLTLFTLNYERAIDALLTQLPVERDEQVKVSQIRTLGRISQGPVKDLRSVPQLRKLLNDPSPIVAKAAADALKVVGPSLREKDPAQAAELAEELVNLIAFTGRVDAQDLRESAVEALAPLRSPAMIDLAQDLLNDRESPRVRIAAFRGLAELGDPDLAELIIDRLSEETQDLSVRLAGIEALGRVAGLVHVDTFLRFMEPREEESVRKAAREAFRSLLPKATEYQLSRIIGQFRNDPEMSIAIRQEWAKRLEARGDPENLAIQRQDIGNAYLRLKKPAEAVPYLQQSLDYYLKQNAGGVATEGLINQLLDALLKSKQYRQAATFGAKMIERDRQQQETVGRKLKNEADQLQERQPADALALIAEALRMNPPLTDLYSSQLRDIRAQIQQNQGSSTPASSGR